MKPGLSGLSGTGTARRRYGSPAPGGSIFTTSAPKSDITVAAAGPAMKLAQSITFNPSKMRSVTNNSLQIFTNEAVRIKRQRFNAEGAKGTRGRRGKFFGRVAPHKLL